VLRDTIKGTTHINGMINEDAMGRACSTKEEAVTITQQ
jgi:hypothetical protein